MFLDPQQQKIEIYLTDFAMEKYHVPGLLQLPPLVITPKDLHRMVVLADQAAYAQRPNAPERLELKAEALKRTWSARESTPLDDSERLSTPTTATGWDADSTSTFEGPRQPKKKQARIGPAS